MNPVGLALVTVLLTASCFARKANETYNVRVSELDSQYAANLRVIESAYATAHDSIRKIQQGLVEVDAENKTVPLQSVAEDPDLQSAGATCIRMSDEIKELQSLGASTIETDAALKECVRNWNDMHVRLLVTTYWAVDLDWILKAIQLDPNGTKIESLFVYSHNLRLKAYVEKQLTVLNETRARAIRELDLERRFAVQQAEIDRETEIAENKRRFAAAMAAAGQAMANSRQSGYQQPSSASTTYGTASAGGCSSDYSCGIGNRCVKENYSGTGYCAKAVNAYGVQTFDLPDMKSVFVKMPQGSDCKFDTHCPIGFSCDTKSGVCLK